MVETSTEAIGLRAKLFRGLSDRSRLAILDALRAGHQTVTQIVQATGLTQPNASNHLSCLLACGLVVRSRQGRFAHYSLSDERVARLIALAEDLLADVARGILECARYEEGDEP